MEHRIFAIYDQKAFAYLPPFTLPRAEMAERTFGECINSNTHQFGKHPADYTLFELGSYDDNSGQLTPHLAPLVVGSGVEYLQRLPTAETPTHDNINALSDGPPVQPSPVGGNSA